MEKVILRNMINQILLEINSIENLWDRRQKCLEFHRKTKDTKDQKHFSVSI